MKGKIVCEESQSVTKEFIKLGHDFYSVDLQACSGDLPEKHIKGDAIESITGEEDFIGAHPTCTYLTNSGVCWLYNKNGTKAVERWIKLELAMKFFNQLKSKIKKGYLENPIPHKYAREGFISLLNGEWVEGIGKYDQLIQPYQFGHLESKATCLWLIDLPKLQETNNLKKEWKKLPKNEGQRLHYLPPGPQRAKLRSKTYHGIAKAMAEQWG